MSDEEIIEGEKYRAVIKAERKERKYIGGREYCTYEVFECWFTGTGLVEDKSTKEKQFFHLVTRYIEDKKNLILRDAIVDYNQNGPFYAGDIKPLLASSDSDSKIVDIVLENIKEQILNSKSEIPIVTPRKLNIDALIERGLILDKEQQAHLPLMV